MITITSLSPQSITTLGSKDELASAKNSLDAVKTILNNQSLGFHQLPDRGELWKKAYELAQTLRSQYSAMVVLGIGGSSLGGKVINDAFGNKADRKLFFCESIDPNELERLLTTLTIDYQFSLKSICWAIISKSGTTLETVTQLNFMNQYYEHQNLNWISQCVIITEPKSNPLSQFASVNLRPQLEIPLDVGGRFSVLSPVGILPAAFLGLDIESMRKGAIQAKTEINLIANLVDEIEKSFHRSEWITLFWSYSQNLKEFTYWLQQLWAESLAKKVNRQNLVAPRVSTPLPCLGPVDQHSLLQQIVEGHKDKFVIFFRNSAAEESGSILKRSIIEGGEILINKKLGSLLKAEAQATQMALNKNGVSNITIQIPRLTESELGFLFMYFELVIASLGEKLNINAFDQPGVELGKVITKKLLSEME